MSDRTIPQYPHGQTGAARGGSIPAGLEEPPRFPSPDPQHRDIPQTYDPRVSVQLDRAARDRAAGEPGVAALEDLRRAKVVGTTSLPPAPRGPEGQAIEGIPPRDVVVTFTTQFASYCAGESAAVTPDEAARLADLGVATEGGGGEVPESPPENVDVPDVSQAGDILTCTMGNWTGEPTSYAYQWQLDGADVGDGTATYTISAPDIGLTMTCIVTATNAAGSTAAPPSNGVVVEAPP